MKVYRIENHRIMVEIRCYRPERVYDALMYDSGLNISEEDAVKAVDWCKDAAVGNVYQDEGFMIFVEEEYDVLL